MFTVTISHLPPECTEEDIISHFKKLAPTHKIANVSMAYDNAKEIEECTKRGDIIRAKVRAVHVSSSSNCSSGSNNSSNCCFSCSNSSSRGGGNILTLTYVYRYYYYSLNIYVTYTIYTIHYIGTSSLLY